MTARTIRTAAELDALPEETVLRAHWADNSHPDAIIVLVGEDGGASANTAQIIGRHHRRDLLGWGCALTVLHDPSVPVLAPVVSDAAVEAAALALIGNPAVDYDYWRQRAREALIAALPLLAAQPVPEASREDVAERVAFKVESVHHIHGTVCLCGFDSHGRARSATEHITRTLLAGLREEGVITERGER